MSAVAAAIDRLFADPNMVRAAVFIPDGGAAAEVRVIAKRPDEIVGLGETRIHTATTLFDVRVSEIAKPRPGDRVTVDGTEYVVQGEPVRDAEQLVWTLEACPAGACPA